MMRITKDGSADQIYRKLLKAQKERVTKETRFLILNTQHNFYFLYSRVSFLRFAGDRLQLLPNKSGDGRLATSLPPLGMLLMLLM